jgi:hypothetical protein
MRLTHPAVTSSVFELVKTIELDIQFGEDSWTTRIELLRDAERADHFRCHVWQLELHRLTPSFPRDENGLPAHVTDACIFTEEGVPRSRIAYPLEDIVAPNVDSALEIVLDDLKSFLKHVTGEEALS